MSRAPTPHAVRYDIIACDILNYPQKKHYKCIYVNGDNFERNTKPTKNRKFSLGARKSLLCPWWIIVSCCFTFKLKTCGNLSWLAVTMNEFGKCDGKEYGSSWFPLCWHIVAGINAECLLVIYADRHWISFQQTFLWCWNTISALYAL